MSSAAKELHALPAGRPETRCINNRIMVEAIVWERPLKSGEADTVIGHIIKESDVEQVTLFRGKNFIRSTVRRDEIVAHEHDDSQPAMKTQRLFDDLQKARYVALSYEFPGVPTDD